MSALAKPLAVFFDWDGTLADSYQVIEGAHDYAREMLGLPAQAPGWFKPWFGRPREEIYRGVYGDQNIESKKHFEDFVRAHHAGKVRPMEGAQEVLEILVSMGVRMGVVSNKFPEFIRAEIEAFGWGHFFAAVLGSAEAAQDKPAADPLWEAMRRAGLDSGAHEILERTWYVGDTEIDLLCARNAGCIPIFITHNEDKSALTDQYKSARIFKNCPEMGGFLLQYSEN